MRVVLEGFAGLRDNRGLHDVVEALVEVCDLVQAPISECMEEVLRRCPANWSRVFLASDPSTKAVESFDKMGLLS